MFIYSTTEFKHEFIPDVFLSFAWDCVVVSHNTEREPILVQLQLLTTNYLFLGHMVFKFRGHRAKL